LAATELWLKSDPFSTEAYATKATAAAHLAKTAGRPLPAELAALSLAINPKDHAALRTAILLSADAAAAKAAFQRLPADACSRAEAAALVVPFLAASEKAAFMSQAGAP
jgi:hypothetical protein